MVNTQLLARVMIVGVITALLLVLVGGILELYQGGSHVVDYTTFHGVPSQLLVFNSARGLIKLGLVVLVITQVARVAVAGWFFIKSRDYFFVAASIFIVVVMLVSLLCRV